jgi:hypothetical protein
LLTLGRKYTPPFGKAKTKSADSNKPHTDILFLSTKQKATPKSLPRLPTKFLHPSPHTHASGLPRAYHRKTVRPQGKHKDPETDIPEQGKSKNN